MSSFSDFFHDSFFGAMFLSLNDPEEWSRVQPGLMTAGIGLWQQRGEVIYLSGGWCELFDIPSRNFMFQEEYLRLIHDSDERRRAREFRDKLFQEPPMTVWQDIFLLDGKAVRSTALATRHGTLLGADILVPEA